jgi:hypothetical protein
MVSNGRNSLHVVRCRRVLHRGRSDIVQHVSDVPRRVRVSHDLGGNAVWGREVVGGGLDLVHAVRGGNLVERDQRHRRIDMRCVLTWGVVSRWVWNLLAMFSGDLVRWLGGHVHLVRCRRVLRRGRSDIFQHVPDVPRRVGVPHDLGGDAVWGRKVVGGGLDLVHAVRGGHFVERDQRRRCLNVCRVRNWRVVRRRRWYVHQVRGGDLVERDQCC